jgi:hypothetical protein
MIVASVNGIAATIRRHLPIRNRTLRAFLKEFAGSSLKKRTFRALRRGRRLLNSSI